MIKGKIHRMAKDRPIKRTAGRPNAFSVDEALERAVQAFWLHGYDGTDLEQIAVSLGATKPSLYRQFGCKKTLFVEALKHYAGKAAYVPNEILQQAPTISEALADLIAFSFKNFTRPGEPQGCFLGCVAIAEAEDHPEAGEIFLEATAKLEAVVNKRLVRAIEENELPKDFPTAQRARLFVNLLHANSLRARAGTSRKTLLSTTGDFVEHVLSPCLPSR